MPGRLSAAGARLAVARAPRGSVRLAAGVLVIAAVAVGELARRSGTDLGAPRAPFFLSPPLFAAHHPWWPLPTLALALAVGVALARAPRLPGWLFLGSAFALALGARLGLAVAQRGVREWWWPLVRPGARDTEYPAAYHLVAHDPLRFIDRFAQLVPTLPVHPAGHPAGATLAFYALDRLAGGPRGSALALCTIGALAVAPTLWLGRALLDEAAARRAVVLFALAPATLVYGATSYDAAFVPIAVLCAWLLVSHRPVWGGPVAAVAFLLSYALALAPLWAAITVGRRRGLQVAAWCAAATVLVLLVLAVAFGYDPIAAVLATRRAYERGIGGHRPQWYWLFGGPAAFLVLLGPLLAERFLAGVERATLGARALAACLVAAALSGVIEAETERILQFAVPLAAVAAAPLLRSRRWLVLGLALGLAEAYLIELRWDATF